MNYWMLVSGCQTALSGILCLLTWHLLLSEVNCGLLMRNGEGSLHAFERSWASLSRPGPFNFCELIETAIGGCKTVKNDHFKALTDRLQEKVKQPDEWYGLEWASNDSHYSTDRNVLQKTLLTNALECNKSEEKTRFRPLDGLSTNPASPYAMNSIERFTTRFGDLNDRLGNYKGLFVTSLLWNTRNIGLSLNYRATMQMKEKQWRIPLVITTCFDVLAPELVQ